MRNTGRCSERRPRAPHARANDAHCMEWARRFLASATLPAVLASLLSLALLLRTSLAIVPPSGTPCGGGRCAAPRPRQQGLRIEARGHGCPCQAAQSGDPGEESAACAERAHHLAHLLEALDELDHLLAAPAAAACDACGTTLLDRLRLSALAGRHRANHRLYSHEFAFIELVGERPKARKLSEDLAQWTHPLDRLQLIQQILHGEAAPQHSLGRGFRLLLVDHGLEVADQPHDIAHPENARGDALRPEGLEPVEGLAGAQKLDGNT